MGQSTRPSPNHTAVVWMVVVIAVMSGLLMGVICYIAVVTKTTPNWRDVVIPYVVPFVIGLVAAGFVTKENIHKVAKAADAVIPDGGPADKVIKATVALTEPDPEPAKATETVVTPPEPDKKPGQY